MISRVDHKDIRIGTLVPGACKIDAKSYINQIIDYGFESFSITFSPTLGNTDLKELANDVKEAIGDRDIKISTISVYGNPLDEKSDGIGEVNDWKSLIDNAHLFGTDIVSGFTGRVVNKPIDESIPKFKEVFSELVKRAEDKGVRIAFENCDMGGTWQSGDWNIAHNPAAWELMFDAVPSDNIGLEWEPCHHMVNLIDPIPQLREWVGKIFHVHGKCCTIKWDIIKKYGIHGAKQFAFHRTPGFGDCNWADIISELRMGGFQGSIDIEGWHDPVYRGDLEMTGQVHALDYLKYCRGGDFIKNPV